VAQEPDAEEAGSGAGDGGAVDMERASASTAPALEPPPPAVPVVLWVLRAVLSVVDAVTQTAVSKPETQWRRSTTTDCHSPLISSRPTSTSRPPPMRITTA
jgi:hypothetical protein